MTQQSYTGKEMDINRPITHGLYYYPNDDNELIPILVYTKPDGTLNTSYREYDIRDIDDWCVLPPSDDELDNDLP